MVMQINWQAKVVNFFALDQAKTNDPVCVVSRPYIGFLLWPHMPLRLS